MSLETWKLAISELEKNPSALESKEYQGYLQDMLRALEKGTLRVCSPKGSTALCGEVPMDDDLRTWEVHSFVKKAILLIFKSRTSELTTLEASNVSEGVKNARPYHGTFSFFDKLDTRQDLKDAKVRVVPPGVIREGAYVGPQGIVMPSFVNIGAFVGSQTMVDTWATVGSCAQVGARVHIAGGVGIGGVLEPVNASPVIIGDDVFLGSRAIVVEGVIVSHKAILGANVSLTASTPILDVTKDTLEEHRGYVPPRAIVLPGTRTKEINGHKISLNCAYIVGYREERHDEKLEINDILRQFE
jgi:2,3,4,5-tetrahydropyridine-2-carboxylate N-succinyltransferase